MNVNVTVQDRQVTALFTSLTAYGRKPTRSLRAIGAELEYSTKQRFIDGVDPTGGKWQPLAWSTIVRRASRGRGLARGGRNVTKAGLFRASFQRKLAGDHQPLMDTRTHLFNTVTNVVTGNSVTIGVAAPWGRIHQFGGMAGRGRKTHIPARSFLGVSLQDRASMVQILTRDVLDVATTGLGATA